MTISILFNLVTDMDNFYNNFINNIPDIVSKTTVQVKHKNIVLDTCPHKTDSIEIEKVLLNDIKQYMRDNEVNHTITV